MKETLRTGLKLCLQQHIQAVFVWSFLIHSGLLPKSEAMKYLASHAVL